MTDEQAIIDIVTLLDTQTLAGAVDRVRAIVEHAPVLGIDAKGNLTIAPGMSVGAALQLLDAGRAAILGTKLAP